MKKPIYLFYLLLPCWLFAKTDLPAGAGKGAAPLNPKSAIANPQSVRAVVIGISDYQDDGIPDLQFAHRDAEIFYEYLRSNAGGALPEANIKLLTNSQATLAAIDDALDWLEKNTKKDDKAILYFSGHGDVEKQTLWQRGYLLAHDTPANNFRNNAVRVEDLDDLVKTLSVGHESKVIIILDACRSGKLANAGAGLTNEQLAKQVENEVRILSCKSDQKSLEGVQWGNGRGLFSYYLVNGLKGLADEGSMPDEVVTFEELKDYLESNVKKALTAPDITSRQNPVFLGDESFELAAVDGPTLLALNQELSSDGSLGLVMAATASPSIAGRGSSKVDETRADALNAFLHEADFTNAVLWPEFQQALDNKDSLLAYFTNKLGIPKTDSKTSAELSQKIAVELHNRAQLAINNYLRGDASELARRQYIEQATLYAQYPKMLRAAQLLLNPDHPLYHRVEVKCQYFEGVYARLEWGMGTVDTNGQTPLEIQLKALELDDKAPYIHNELGLIYLMSNDLVNAEKHFKLAAELAPGWALPPANLSIVYNAQNNPGQATINANKAIELQPNYFAPYTTLGKIALDEKNYLRAETMYSKAMQLNKGHFLAYQEFGEVCLATTRYSEADMNFYIADSLLSISIPPPPDMDIRTAAGYNTIREKPTAPVRDYVYTLHRNPNTVKEWMNNGEGYLKMGNYDAAVMSFRKVIELEPSHPKVHELLGQVLLNQGRYEEAALSFEKLLKIRPDEPALQLLLADVYQKKGRWVEEEAIYRNLINDKGTLAELKSDAYVRLAQLVGQQQRYWEQEQLMVEYEALYGRNPAISRLGFYENMVQRHPGNLDGLNKLANYYESQNNRTRASDTYAQILQKDSLWEGSGFMHTRIGYNAGNDSMAIAHFKAAIRLLPGLSSPKLDLARIYHRHLEFDQEISILEDLLNNGQIDLVRRLQLADLYMLSHRFSEADTLLVNAEKIRFEEIPGFYELRGKLELLRGQPKTAIGFYEKELAFDEANDQAEICYTIARLHAMSGDKDQAWIWLQKAISNGFNYEWVLRNDKTWKEYKQRFDSEKSSNPKGGG